MRYVCLVVKPFGFETQSGAPALSLGGAGIKTFEVEGVPAAREMLALLQFDAVLVLESVVSSREGDVLANLKAFRAPVIVCAGGISEHRTVRLLEAGAANVIDARASSRLAGLQVLRVIEASKGSEVETRPALALGPLRLDPLAFSGHVNGRPLVLTLRQFDVLFMLAVRPGKIIPRRELERLLELVEGKSGRSVDMQICRLRRCLREAGDSSLSIRTVYGFGYCLTVSQPEANDVAEQTALALHE